MINNNNFIVIQGFMVNELKLKGNDLLIYAIIYGFSQTDNQYFTGSRQYLADWTNSTVRGVQKNLNGLVERGLIVKEEIIVKGEKRPRYKINNEFSSLVNSVLSPSEQSSHNNIDNNINNIIEENKKAIKEKKDKRLQELQGLVNNFTDNQELKDTLQDFITMRKEIKKPITPTGLKRLLNKLSKFSTDMQLQIQILEQSINHNWQDIYQLKTVSYEHKGDYTPYKFPNYSHKTEQKDNDDLIEI